MDAKDFYMMETECEIRFNELGPCYHLCTSEDRPVIFHNENEFKIAMNLVALSLMLFPDIKILTFEVMNNHFHFAICGNRERILEWFGRLVTLLMRHPGLKGSMDAISSLQEKLILIEDINNLRNVIAYINRNGFIVDNSHTPFSYPWGANRYFFNDIAKDAYEALKTKATLRWKRNMFHSNFADNLKELYWLDGYVSPMCFCCIRFAEGLFLNAHQYFSKISRNVESSSVIAKEIGESLFYTDNELFSVVAQKCSQQYGCKSPAMIPSEAKVSMAKMMRFDYNASVKQISRILRMEIDIVRRLFPEL